MEYYKIILCIFIFIIALYLGILGYNQTNTNYHKDYIKTVGKVTDKIIESIDTVERKKNKFRHIKKFRIKLTYSYKVKKHDGTIKEYTGTFYNDGNNEEFLEDKKYIPIGNMYKSKVMMNVFYNKEKPHDSCVNFNDIKNRKKRIYYIISFILFFILPFIIFIDF